MYPEIVIPLLLVLVAFLYSSVGHGGASGYLAILALFSISPSVMKPSALILNIFVSFIAFVQYYRAGHFNWKLFFCFAITSIPFSYLGSTFPIDDSTYKRILGVCLLFPILRLIGLFGKSPDNPAVQFDYRNILIGLLIGIGIGFLSGMLGIGGGILLTPIILLLSWSGMKQAAAVSALFIFVNSISGLIGLYNKGLTIPTETGIWLCVAISGGLAGAYLGSKKFDNLILKYILAFVLSIASLKLILI